MAFFATIRWSVLTILMLSQVNAEGWTEWVKANEHHGTVHTLASSSSNDYITEICVRVRTSYTSKGKSNVWATKATFASGETTGWIGLADTSVPGQGSSPVDECFSLNSGDCIDDIDTTAGRNSDDTGLELQFTTSDGDVYGPYGNEIGGTQFNNTAVDGECLLKFEVQVSYNLFASGDTINQIRYYFGALPAEPATATGDCQTIESRLSSIESHLSQIASASGAHSSIGAVDSTFTEAVDQNLWSGSTVKVNGKDLVTITSVAVNVVLIVSVAIMCFRKGHSSKQYEAVSIASD